MAYPSINKSYMQTKYNVTKCAKRNTIKYIVIHYTGTTASAKNNCKYFGCGNRKASADYFIDKNGTIYKFNGDCSRYYTWHCGDGKGKYGITNANSIGIEVVSKGGEFTAKQQAFLQKLVTAIMADYGVKDSNVVRHYDASRKKCPAAYCGSSAKDKKWKELHAYITGSKAATTSKATATSTTKKDTATQTLCAEVQKALGVTADKVFGTNSGKAWASKVGHVSTLKNRKSKWALYVQRALIAKEYSCGKYGADGVFGTDSDKALRKFQKAKGLAVDGKAGKETCKKLFN